MRRAIGAILVPAFLALLSPTGASAIFIEDEWTFAGESGRSLYDPVSDIYRFESASEPRVRVYASGLDMPLSDDDLRRFYRRLADAGVSAGKLKIGLDLERDMRRLKIFCVLF